MSHTACGHAKAKERRRASGLRADSSDSYFVGSLTPQKTIAMSRRNRTCTRTESVGWWPDLVIWGEVTQRLRQARSPDWPFDIELRNNAKRTVLLAVRTI